jgi:hypothetical protein
LPGVRTATTDDGILMSVPAPDQGYRGEPYGVTAIAACAEASQA